MTDIAAHSARIHPEPSGYRFRCTCGEKGVLHQYLDDAAYDMRQHRPSSFVKWEDVKAQQRIIEGP